LFERIQFSSEPSLWCNSGFGGYAENAGERGWDPRSTGGGEGAEGLRPEGQMGSGRMGRGWAERVGQGCMPAKIFVDGVTANWGNVPSGPPPRATRFRPSITTRPARVDPCFVGSHALGRYPPPPGRCLGARTIVLQIRTLGTGLIDVAGPF